MSKLEQLINQYNEFIEKLELIMVREENVELRERLQRDIEIMRWAKARLWILWERDNSSKPR